MAPKLFHIVILLAGCSHPAFLRGQQLFLDADTNAIDIGGQTHLTLRFEQLTQETADVQWPALEDTLANGFEILKRSPIDTTRADGLLQFSQRILITCFDTGFAVIEPIEARLNGDIFTSNPLLIEVRAPELAADAEIKDIKDIRRTSFTAWHQLVLWLRHYWYIPLSVLLVSAGLYFFFRLKRRDATIVQSTQPPPDTRPAHIIALQALRALEAKKLCENGRSKAYYIELTDILRRYIEHRWDIPALERTTRELQSALQAVAMNDEMRETLLQTLRLADAVKFARYSTMPPENEQSFKNALRFVEATAQRETTTA